MIGARWQREKEIRAEAAGWLARIHSDEVSDSDIAEFQIWFDEDLRHKRAFASVTSLWEAVGAVKQSRKNCAPERPVPQSLLSRRNLVLAAGLAGAIASVWNLSHSPVEPNLQPPETYSTGIGEQRRVALPDGSLAILDTDSSIAVEFVDGHRTVHQQKGRVNFQVAHDPLHPFVVQARGISVIAVGTSFDVTSSDTSVGVVLITGTIQVVPIAKGANGSRQEMHSPGEHIVFSGPSAPLRDVVDLSVATAWQDGRAVFNDTTLAEAVAEMNRYTHRPIVLSPDIAQSRISGNYRTGDSEAFAMSLSELLPATATFSSRQIVLKAKDTSQRISN